MYRRCGGKIGVEKAKKYALDADLIIYMVDSSVPLNENDDDIMKMIQGKKTIILLNKTDLDMVVTEEILKQKNKNEGLEIIRISAKENKGIYLLEEKIKEMFFHGEISFQEDVVITNMRHKEAIRDAYESMLQVRTSLENHMPEDFYSIDLMSAYASLGTIIGEEVGEDLVNEIFSKFCMGK